MSERKHNQDEATSVTDDTVDTFHSGGPELALVLEEKGYDWAKEELAAAA
jgi:Fe-S cluster assembly ATPase SufC